MVGGTRGFVVGGEETSYSYCSVMHVAYSIAQPYGALAFPFAVSVRQIQSRRPTLVIVCTFHVGRYRTSTVGHDASVARIQFSYSALKTALLSML